MSELPRKYDLQAKVRRIDIAVTEAEEKILAYERFGDPTVPIRSSTRIEVKRTDTSEDVLLTEDEELIIRPYQNSPDPNALKHEKLFDYPRTEISGEQLDKIIANAVSLSGEQQEYVE